MFLNIEKRYMHVLLSTAMYSHYIVEISKCLRGHVCIYARTFVSQLVVTEDFKKKERSAGEVGRPCHTPGGPC